MKVLFLTAFVLIVSIGLSSAYDTYTSEGHIKDLIQRAKNKCSNCQDSAEKVLTRNNKGDICDAVDVYQLCTISCISDSVVNEVHDAQKICNGASVIQMSVIFVLLMAIARILF